eukprot:g27254.t2
MLQVSGVPRESPDFDPELHVPDISSSEDDGEVVLSDPIVLIQEVPQEDRRESEKGCHWTARLKMEMCGQDGCHESEILAFDFQRRLWDFYEGKSSAPPLEEASLIKSMPFDELHGAFQLCPGMVLGPSGEEFETMTEMWPVLEGQHRAELARAEATSRDSSEVPSVDIVIARCSTTLRWLWSLPLPPQARVVVYSKCEERDGNLERQLEGACGSCLSLYKLVFGEELQGRLSTYCCGHFIVSSKRIRSVPPERLENLLSAVQQGAYTALAGGLCEVANMPCYVVEYLWHAVRTWSSQEVPTGEEDEDEIYSQRSKLYRFKDGEWKERGLGDSKLLRHRGTGKIRYMMRQERTGKIVANHYIYAFPPYSRYVKCKKSREASPNLQKSQSSHKIQ